MSTNTKLLNQQAKNGELVLPTRETTPSFFEKRMDELEVTELNNRIRLENPEAQYPMPRVTEVPIFEEDSKGNICINFYNLRRQRYTYYQKGNGKMSAHNQKPRNYQQIRLKDPKGDMKYVLPKGQGIYPFLPPALVDHWEKGDQIETLYLTEGAFKAWKACLYGAMTVGLTSITHYRSSENYELHEDIQRLIIDCKVKKVVILWDGDCRDISQKQLFDRIDIAKRPRGFFNAAKSIKKLVEEIPLLSDRVQVYFFHVRSECFDTAPKGLDDLLIEGEKRDQLKVILKELTDVSCGQSFFFYKHNISGSTAALYQYFKLHDIQAFYHFHSEQIQNQDFNFDKNFWIWNEGQSKLELISPEWASNIKWIGDNFFKIVTVPRINKFARQELHQRSKQTLIDLHGKGFLKHLKHYEGFCNVPNHFDYRSEYGNFYNLYNPFRHQAEQGDCATTLAFIQHIFGKERIQHNGKTYSSYDLGLDYLQLLINEPEQMLPVLILYSKENNTGKSTFGKWLKYLFGHNAVQIGNQDFKSEFNEHWANKLLAICEETLLDRKKDVELIKAYATSNRITVNPKGTKRYEIDFFCKFQFYSNNKRMIYVTKYDQRFWIRQVPVPKEDNPNLLQKMKEELPAFLYLMRNRSLSTQKESRMHFHPNLIRTNAFLETVKINEPRDATNLREQIKMMFLDFDLSRILMPLKAINQEFFNGKAQIHWMKEILKDYLEVDKLRDKNTGKVKQVRSEYYRWEKDFDGEGREVLRRRIIKFNDRPYVFHRKDFVGEDDEFVTEKMPYE